MIGQLSDSVEGELLPNRPDSKDLRDFARLPTAFNRGFEPRTSNRVYTPSLATLTARPLIRHLTHNSPKFLEWKLAQEKFERFSHERRAMIFPIKLRNYKLWKMPKLSNFMFPEGWYFLKCDYTERKRSSEMKFSVSERHRWAVVG